MPVLDREEYIEQAYFFHAFRERLARRPAGAGRPGADRRGAALDDPAAAGRLVPRTPRSRCIGPDGPGHGAARPLLHAVPGPRRRPGRARRQPVRDGPGPADPGARGEVQGRRPHPRRPVRLPVRGPLAQPARLRQGPRGDGRRPVLQRGLARLHPDRSAPGSATSISPT